MNQLEYNFIYSNSVRLCVDLIIPFGHGFLMGKRSHEPYLNKYAFPGGGVKFGETLNQAAQRLCKGELGVELDIIKSLCPCMEFLDEISISNRHSVSIAILVKIFGQPKLLPETFIDIKDSSKIPFNEMVYQHGKFITQYTREKENNLISF